MPNAPWGPITREGRNEFQLLVAIISFYAGFAQIIMSETSRTIAQLDPLVQFLWGWFLLFGGALVLISAAWRRADEGLAPFLETAGLFLISGAMLTFGFSVWFAVDNPVSAFSAPLAAGLGLACLSRSIRVIHTMIPKKHSRVDDLKKEVQKQLVEQARQQAEEIVETGRMSDTGPLPVADPDNEKGGSR